MEIKINWIALFQLLYFSYVLFRVTRRFPWIESFSASFYELRDAGYRSVFPGWMWGAGLPMFLHPTFYPHSNLYDFLIVMSGISLACVAIAGEFRYREETPGSKDKITKPLHYGFAIVSILCAFSAFVVKYGWVYGMIPTYVFGACCIIIYMSERLRRRSLYWVEFAATYIAFPILVFTP